MKGNLILIGMPGAGKSVVGQLLAARLGFPFSDTDTMIEQAAGQPIPALFQTRGEAYFRDLEAEMARAAAAMRGAVIATGGGIILRPANMTALRSSGLVFFLDRSPAAIAAEPHDGRPLISGDRDRVFALYEARIALYRAYADYIITNDAAVDDAATEILRIWKREERA